MAESRITAVSANNGYSLALNDNGTVWVWGKATVLSEEGLQPIIMPGVDRVVAIAGYGQYPVVLKDDGTVWLLANYPDFENVSLLANDTYKEPIEVPGLDNIVAIAGSDDGNSLLMLSKNGTVWELAWINQFGILGTSVPYFDGSYNVTIPNLTNDSSYNLSVEQYYQMHPVQVAGLSNITAIAGGAGHALALKSDGTVWSWGQNDVGQRGDGTFIQHPNDDANGNPVPGMVKGLTNVTSISAGYLFSVALEDNGTVWTWGWNMFGELGDGIPGNAQMNSTTPVQVTGLTNVTAITSGEDYTLALKNDGTVWIWGEYDGYQLINNEPPYYYVPTQVQNLSDIVSISANWKNNMALDKNGVIWAWGDDEYGQLGDGRDGVDLYQYTPEPVPFSEALANQTVVPSTSVSSPEQPIQPTPTPSDNDIEYMAAVNDTIYSFTMHGLTALNSKGAPEWNISIPGLWTYSTGQIIPVWKNDSGIDMGQMFQPVPIYATDNGYIYLYTIKNPSDGSYDAWQDMASLQQPEKDVVKELIAVSPDGKIAWTHDFTDDVAVGDTARLEAQDGLIYLYHDYNETVFDTSGNVLLNLENISSPVSVDEGGNIYAVTAVSLDSQNYYNEASGQYLDYRIPSNIVEKLSPDGSIIWSKTLDANVSQPYYLPSVWNDGIGLPLYDNGILYVPQASGVTALDTNGNVLWNKALNGTTYQVFNLMPLDSKGDIYLSARTLYDANYTIIAISPNGTEIASYNAGPYIASAYDGVIYVNGNPSRQNTATVGGANLETTAMTAYDLLDGKNLWNFTTPIGQPNTVIINASNVGALFPDYSEQGMPSGSIINNQSTAEIIPAGDLTYIYYRTYVNDEPVVYNQSTYTYYSALYAVDKNGKLVLQKPMNGFMTAAAVNNSTIYYGTSGGGISVITVVVVIAAGLVLIGAVLIGAKFFLFGTVSRARSRLDKNDNRNRIYKFIAERPGSTLYEMSKELKINKGTLGYHLMILGINHRIVKYDDEGKFVRYFINSNRYSKEEQALISMMRRDTIGRIIQLMHLKPGLTNAEISIVIGLADSGVSRYLNELSDKGIISKTEIMPGRYAYSLTVEASKTVDKLYWVMNGEGKEQGSTTGKAAT
jgi:alpha-tubulin suppressor-like RCC1 family protein/predicted transcriptional regulator